jgi:2-polyprenyl-3-methyl-5-hydroxy-6-metoxy-1,4-benzoquinol methylase
MNREGWNKRYAAGGLLWGVEPNRFVAAEAADLPPGRALDLACGEGRNAVWLAAVGWNVTAIDYSDVAIHRARELAAERGVAVRLEVGDVVDHPLESQGYDLVLLAYVHLPPGERLAVLARAAASVAPRGTLLLVEHHRRNLEEGAGGPRDPSLLWETDEVVERLQADGLEIEHAGEVLRDVEGAERPAIDLLVRATRPAQG